MVWSVRRPAQSASEIAGRAPSRNARALLALLAGNLVVQVLSLAVALHALVLHVFPVQGAPAVVIHFVPGTAFALYVIRGE